ncbi:hypothetical protein NE237_026633 [Protea cynaroides]|uniref:Heat shock protein 90 n=1 Tax=Protea cynaroides TaxID=273540 RepID=A0A9Q0K1N8_9MAGN|nr:hypothetical protein NE237_026633 [Protea cynaroides]
MRYFGAARVEESLNILLEFVLDGSISSMIGKFGSFRICPNSSSVECLEERGNIFADSCEMIKFASLLHYCSTKSGDDVTSLKDYVTKMKEGQKDIFYITGESKKAVENSLILERLKKRGYEVLFMVDAINEYAVGKLKEYDGKKLVSTIKEGLTLDDEPEEEEKKSF